MARKRVLIVDDSALTRTLLGEILSRDPELEVVGAVGDPYAAWDKIKELNPDVLTLDVEMPKMDGITFLKKLMSAKPMPVLMVSTLTECGNKITMEALEHGAIDFVTKPKIDVTSGTIQLAGELIEKVKTAAYSRVRVRPIAPPSSGTKAASADGRYLQGTHKLILIGGSTGGTEALQDVLLSMPADCPGILAVIHMPPGFTKAYAARLDRNCRMNVREARDGDTVLPGHVLVAPGALHMEVYRSGAVYKARVRDGEAVSRHKPSVDVLFASAAKELGPNAVGAILTGMGNDGAAGMAAMHRAGACTLAQNEETCVVFGMPREAIAAGGVTEVLPLERIGPRLLQLANEKSVVRV
jgi:two-component system chemotaxis response regulator CheB